MPTHIFSEQNKVVDLLSIEGLRNNNCGIPTFLVVPPLYAKDKYTDSYFFLLLNVDDMLIAGSSMREIKNLKRRLSAIFEMKDLGPAKQIFGMKISRDRSVGTLNLSQELYIEKLLSRFRVNDAKPRTTLLANHFKLSKEQSPKTAEERDHMALVPYASTVGSLMYAMVCTRPDIAHAVGVVSSTSLCFGKGKVTLQVFVDADLGGDVDSSKSTSAEYVAIAEVGKNMIWLTDYLEELG
uniref:Reverse transcriptase Ty1/copia-type domain-containing protein n=1 Tax=Solanum lycopersicum TaxID=4081 RepID=A0A3Q7G998_SOLLC